MVAAPACLLAMAAATVSPHGLMGLNAQWERAQPWQPHSWIHGSASRPPARQPAKPSAHVQVARHVLLVIDHRTRRGTGSFGISAGTWIPARLVRGISDADPGWAELRSTHRVEGTDRVLPEGSLFFAEKRYNPAAGRIELTLVELVLANGKTLPLSGLVFDRNRRPGLPALVTAVAPRRGIALLRWRHWLASALGDATARYGIARPGGLEARGTSTPGAFGSHAYCAPQAVLIQVMKDF